MSSNLNSNLPVNSRDGSAGGFRHKDRSDLATHSNVGDTNTSSGFDPAAAGMDPSGNPLFKTVSDNAKNGSGFTNNLDRGNAGRLTDQDNSQSGTTSGIDSTGYSSNNTTTGYTGSSNPYGDTYNTTSNDTGYSGVSSGNAFQSTGGINPSSGTGDRFGQSAVGGDSAFASSGDSGFASGGSNLPESVGYGQPDQTGRGPQTKQVGTYP